MVVRVTRDANPRLARLLAPEALFGAGLTGLGVFVLVAGQDIVSPVPWGPGLMPEIVGAGLVALGFATLVERVRIPVSVPDGGLARVTPAGVPSHDERTTESEDDWLGFALVLAAVAAFGVLVEPAGFPLAAALMFALVARGFGSRRPAWDFLIGLALAALVYVVFALLLGLQLSWGGALESALEGR
jgi:putative tricarboxylic transport membrane protein